MNHGMPARAWYRRLPVLAAIWLVIAALLAIQFWTVMPPSWFRWILLLALGPPLYVLGEAFFAWLLSPAHGRTVSPKRFSVARIAIALPAVLVVFALFWWLSWLLARP